MTEYAVDPAQIATVLAAKVTFDTGLLGGDTLLVRQEGVEKVVVEYRRGQYTGLYLEGSDTPIRVPLPPLVMIRKHTSESGADYRVYAVKRRPTSLDVDLYVAPLPNIFGSGGVCWGSVQRQRVREATSTSLAEGWDALLGSPFGDHAVGGKSQTHNQDIRQKLIQLEKAGAKRYPTNDLVPAKKTLSQAIGGMS